MPLLSISYPSWLNPEIIPGLPVRWYGLMYIVAFAVAYFLYRRQIKERNFPMSDEHLSSLFFWGILGLLLGARLFSAIVYHPVKPWLIFWPFDDRGNFTGLQGMSYHGGTIGGCIGVILFAKFKKYSFREIVDMFVAAIPLGYTFGRLGNFTNAELYGRVTSSPLGMIFPGATPVSASEGWVQEIAGQTGIAITDTMIKAGSLVNLPRHPSQLYEAFFEGIVLWAIIWFFRSRRPFKGFLMGLYLIGYGFFRFCIEYFREPDSHMGYPLEFVKSTLSPTYSHPLLSFSTGQILCFVMIVIGAAWLVIASRLPNKEAIYIYSEEEAKKAREEEKQTRKAENATQRKKQRKLRKKLR